MSHASFSIYFDGACLPYNPGGIVCYGYVIKEKGGKVIAQGKGIDLEKKTNNEAEYVALIKALEEAIKKFNLENVLIYGDSQLVVNQINGSFEVRSSNLLPLYLKTLGLLKNFKNWKVQWIPRDKNEEADFLSKKAFLEYVELKNYEKARLLEGCEVKKLGYKTYQVKNYVVQLNNPLQCNCLYFQKMNAYPLIKKSGLTIKCKHILFVEKKFSDRSEN